MNYLEIFEKYNEKTKSQEQASNHNDNRLLSQYFKLDYTYLSFMDSQDAGGDVGANDDNVFMLKTNTGKTKITVQNFIKYLDLFNPEITQVPFEFVKFY